MKKIKTGDIVTHNSYSKNLLFTVKNIFVTPTSDKVLLTGLSKSINTVSHLSDLNLLHNPTNLFTTNTVAGSILHLDGDRKYSRQAYKYYLDSGLNAVVRNIPESKQPQLLHKLLLIYHPDILIVTGHDSMIKKGRDFNNIYNYRSSKYFLECVKIARQYEKEQKQNISIFAGACQSYFEALIAAGANFASSPARILIDFMDPLIIATKLALTEKKHFVTIDEISSEIRDGKRGVNGIGSFGKMIST